MFDKVCPHCRFPLPWKRLYLANWPWARWKCAHCGSTLAFDGNRRGLLGIALVGTMFGGWALEAHVPGSSARTFYGLATVLWMFLFYRFDRVIVVQALGTRCRQCGYDLTALASDRCPECGEPVRSADNAALPDDRGDI